MPQKQLLSLRLQSRPFAFSGLVRRHTATIPGGLPPE